MDKKNTFFGVLLLIAAVLSMVISARYSAQHPTPAAERKEFAAQTAAATPAASGPVETTPGGSQAAFAAAASDYAGAKITTLENGFIQVRFTDFGGAVRDVALKKYPAVLGDPSPFLFNQLRADPALAVVDFPGLDRKTKFELVSQSATEVVYRTIFDHRLEVTRRYVLAPDAVDTTDPYQLRTETTIRNLATTAAPPMTIALALGTAAPADLLHDCLQLTTASSDGKDQTFIMRSRLEASGGMFGFNAHDALPAIATPGPVVWGAVSNKFFAGIFTPDTPGAGLITRRVKLLTALPDADRNAYGVTDDIQLNVPAIAPGAKATLGGEYYVGPREYHRLANTDVFKVDQNKIMNFGWFKFFSQMLLTLMTWIHSFVPNWGLAIILTTLTLKLIFIYPTLSASRSAKRMQKLQPQLKVINEKYKDNPQKKNTATMELFKEHKVNPAGGCIPLLITMPFFIGFFKMLYSTAELRFAPFLWAHDLSAPDTVGHIYGLPINVLPLILGIVSFTQIRLAPQPTVDNAQAKMMMFTPVIFLVFCYNYSCALALYSTTNGLFTIGQQLIINRMKDDGDPANAAAKSGGKVMKNVTPGKRK